MAFLNFNHFASRFNLDLYLVFINNSFMTFLFSGTFFSFLVLGDILEVLFRYHVAILLKLDVRDLFGDFGTDVFTLLLRPQERNLTGFCNTMFLTLLLIP